MYETPARRVVRAGPMAGSLRVGNELFVPIVTEPTRSMTIQLPPGQWIDYWDESQVYSGSLSDFPVPLGREPIFVRQGSLVPMEVQRPYTGHGTRESKGSLTLLVYPSGTSSFRFRNAALEPWITFGSTLAGDQLTLTASVLPSSPVLYRVARWEAAPSSVGVSGVNVTVNQGGDVPAAATEAAVNGSRTSAWYYDAKARRLIVKAVP
jgi:alpha-D-xyloside xylohydrolase